MSLGPLMIDIAGVSLTDADRELLQNPLIGGVILFSRNYQTPQQISQLCADIHALRTPSLLISVDHEGGRVQRFLEGFVHLPAGAQLGKSYANNPAQAEILAETTGWLLGAELRAVGVDFSFTPVLDLDYGMSEVIGNRALDQQADTVALLGNAVMRGLQRAGMSAVGKHFPGHGAVVEDSHHAIPIDKRDWDSIQNQDLVPFAKMIAAGLPAIMPAHVIYAQLDSQAAGFSTFWLQTVLRQQLNFDGVIFSDDLSMEGATVAGNISERAEKALQAGCDVLLICNDRAAVLEVLPSLHGYENAASQARLQRLIGQPAPDWDSLHLSEAFKNSQQTLSELA